ncbi:MAG: NAD-glutamate dehydrogenase [Proteobacteria bacterium]|nr:NAD-glutamate dehydrogenase [Pseudomonadota bacterium]
MPYKKEEAKQDIIQKLDSEIHKHIQGEKADLMSEFVTQFYGVVAEEDLLDRAIPDLYGAALAQWEIMKERHPNETKIHVFNPSYEENAWQSTHTIIQIIQNDIPFLIDSITMELTRLGFTIHLIISFGGMKICRDAKGKIYKILPYNAEVTKEVTPEAPMYIEIDRVTDPKVLEDIKTNLERVLTDVREVVEDWKPMRQKMNDCIAGLDKIKNCFNPDELAETKAFLTWILDDHFTFLGYVENELEGEGDEKILRRVPNSGLGVLRDDTRTHTILNISKITEEARKILFSPEPIVILTKLGRPCTVHRSVNADYLGVKKVTPDGKVIGEYRFMGLYTSAAYNSNPKDIPFLRHKVDQILAASQLNPKSHSGKALLNILETLPRDDLFQASVNELLELTLSILHLQERRRIRFFARKDLYGRFISCYVYVPRERYNTELQKRMQEVLRNAFKALDISYTTRFSESVLARIHYMIKIDPEQHIKYDVKEIEKQLIEIGKTWNDELHDYLIEYFGEEKGIHLSIRYAEAFQASYRESFSPRMAVYDLKHLESLSEKKPLEMNFYRPLDDMDGMLHFKLYKLDKTITLSDVIPIFENMGMRVISEKPYEITLKESSSYWINDFTMSFNRVNTDEQFDMESMKEVFQDAFAQIWFGIVENDGFNKLVLAAGLTWHEITIVRAYAKYLRQTGFTFSQSYIEETLLNQSSITKNLVKLFHLRFSPNRDLSANSEIKALEEQLEKDMDLVTSLDEDRILRRYLDVIRSTLRTNYYQLTEEGTPKPYLSFKIDSMLLPELPLPRPLYEIFVYSPQFEGIHLRSSKVARGGLRWSDRPEDFRREILGLMKAQQVKNAVIVPSGAKGGFVPKSLPINGTREQIMEEAIACYKNFIRGLLDITDNMKGGEVIFPDKVVRYDENDVYLVVAADKGTATFSDIANSIAREYEFWLDDAFASGGSAGYDHKKMGITARGAWESVKRHFRELGKNIQKEPFTVVGIGDMAGDVFGNGMLLSQNIKLLVAFNHMHIFLDPNPEPMGSFKERERLFNLPRSTWADYNPELISPGGGVFLRSVKSIKLSAEVKAALGLQQDFILPNDLIRAALRAPVDLLWNGGIGTFVKATNESNSDVGDRTNDNIRINACELKCKVIGEGGNLGFTQLGRTEFASEGGKIYTDFIDNSGGVDCSDHEVNIKILLNAVVSAGDMTIKQRNVLLAEMTNEVADLVLIHNYRQTQAISLAVKYAPKNLELHARYIRDLERAGKLDRALEFLPDEQDLLDRKLAGKGLTAPGIAILLAYSKNTLKEQILDSDVPEDPYLSNILERAFPTLLRKKYHKQMENHRLRREIIATQLSSGLVNEVGFAFVYRLSDETGSEPAAIVRAYAIARHCFDVGHLREEIEALDNQVDADVQITMLMECIRMIRRATRWILRNCRFSLDITSTIDTYLPGVNEMMNYIPECLDGNELEVYHETIKKYSELKIPESLAKKMASLWAVLAAFDIASAAQENTFTIKEVTKVYFAIGDYLDLAWIRNQIIALPVDNHWEALTRESLRDDIDWQQRLLAISILKYDSHEKDLSKRIKSWINHFQVLVNRWQYMVADLKANASTNFTMYFAAVRELVDLTQSSFQAIRMAGQNAVEASVKNKGKKGEKET